MSREEGLSSDTVYGVAERCAGAHLAQRKRGPDALFDPNSQSVKTYHREHGLQGEEFDYNAYYRLRDGRLCFGGPGGFNIFDPTRLTENTHAPRVALTNLEVLGVPVPSATPYWLLDRIELDYGASIVSLDFGALDFISPKRNRAGLSGRRGFSDRWIDLGTQHRVTLTNLDAGDHLLEVRAANADSVWSDPPLRLTIHRDPAPWRSRVGVRPAMRLPFSCSRPPGARAPERRSGASSRRSSGWSPRSRCARASSSRATGSWRRRRKRRAISLRE